MNDSMRNRLADERGVAMMMALGFMLTAGVVVAVALAYATSLQPQARHGQDRVEALSAAQAGIDHYLGHLNKDRNYFATADCANPAMKGPTKDPALLGAPCGWTASTPYGWVKVQPDDPKSAEFHYDINSAQMDQFTIWVSSTGRSGATTRTLQAKVSIAGSQRYLYVTDFEDADPENPVVYPTGTSYDACGKSGTTKAKYWWQPSPNDRAKSGNRSSSPCVEIQFIAADTLDGPVHFNDTPYINGNATFKQGFTTYASGCPKTATTSASAAKAAGCYVGSGSPSLSTKGARWANVNLLPDTTGDLVNKPGCQYTGDTRIRFNSNGTMDVWNTMSAGTAIGFVGSPAVLASAPNCGNATNFKPASGQKYPAAKQTVPVPDGLVIYVRNSSTSATCTPGQIVNGTTSGSATKDVIPTASTSLSGTVSDIGFVFPTYRRTRSSSGWSAPSVLSDAHSRKWDCGLGNVYVEGTVKGRVTIAAENNVVVTGDLAIANTALGSAPGNDPSDIAGLVAQNAVVVYHPVEVTSWSITEGGGTSQSCGSTPASTPSGGSTGATCTYTPSNYTNLDYLSPPTTGSDSKKHRWIYASIQTLAHSFWVESYSAGAPPGILSVRGSIAQRWRGIVGTGSISTGYIKDYSYDKRLQTNSPPYFPPWANGDWAAETTGELQSPDGIS